MEKFDCFLFYVSTCMRETLAVENDVEYGPFYVI